MMKTIKTILLIALNLYCVSCASDSDIVPENTTTTEIKEEISIHMFRNLLSKNGKNFIYLLTR